MLVYLKYHKAKAGSDADAAPFAEVLGKYSSLPPSEKKTLSKFQKNKKDLSWTQTFHENVDEVSTQKEASISGFFNPFEIVKMNGFEPSSMQQAQISGSF